MTGFVQMSLRRSVPLQTYRVPLSRLLSSSRASSCSRSLFRNSFHVHVRTFTASTLRCENQDHESFFNYTSSRWTLGNEELRSRYRKFNVSELQAAAAKSVGSNSCVSMEKLADGRMNRVFKLVMEDGNSVVAKIPYLYVDDKEGHVTKSEVATMEFARTVLKMPVPKIYAWSASAENAVGAEYVIMEEASGMLLSDCWEAMGSDARVTIMRQLVEMERRMLSLSFSKYGSLYFASDAVERSQPAEIIRGDTDSELKAEILTRFTIGPVVAQMFMHRSRVDEDGSAITVDRGPWTDPSQYACAIAEREIAWLKKYAVLKIPNDANDTEKHPAADIELFEKFKKVVPALMGVEKPLQSSCIWHPDWCCDNIFVDSQNRISRITDWQGVWACPIFLHAEVFEIIENRGETILVRPDDFDDLEDEEKDHIKRQIYKSTLLNRYIVDTERRNPLMGKVLQVKNRQTRSLVFKSADSLEIGGIAPLRQALISIEKNWEEIAPNSECPIHFSEEKLKIRTRANETRESTQGYKVSD